MITTPTQPCLVASIPLGLPSKASPFRPVSASAPTSPRLAPLSDTNDDVFDHFLGKGIDPVARVTYFFDDGHCGGFLSIPHLGRHGSAHTAGVARILERWLVEKTSNPAANTTIIPILEEPIGSVTQAIIERLRVEGSNHLASLAKVAIHVTTGHIFTLSSCCDDEGVQWAANKFKQEYPLFLDLTIHTVPFSQSPTQPLLSTPCLPSPSPYRAISYTQAQFSKDPTRTTEILLHFQKINLDDM